MMGDGRDAQTTDLGYVRDKNNTTDGESSLGRCPANPGDELAGTELLHGFDIVSGSVVEQASMFNNSVVTAQPRRISPGKQISIKETPRKKPPRNDHSTAQKKHIHNSGVTARKKQRSVIKDEQLPYLQP